MAGQQPQPPTLSIVSYIIDQTHADPTRPDPTRPDPTRPNPTQPGPTRPDPARYLGACPPTGTTLTIIALGNSRFTRSALGQQARKNQLEIGHRILTSGLCAQSWMASERGGREKWVGTGEKEPRNSTIATITTPTATTTTTTH